MIVADTSNELDASLDEHIESYAGAVEKKKEKISKVLRQGKAVMPMDAIILAPTQAERTTREQSDFLLWENVRGEFLDFHSFRASFITSLVEGGATIKQVQLLARHKDATTTLKHYIKCKVKAELAGVVSALPALMVSTPPECEQKRPPRRPPKHSRPPKKPPKSRSFGIPREFTRI
jgi:integrase